MRRDISPLAGPETSPVSDQPATPKSKKAKPVRPGTTGFRMTQGGLYWVPDHPDQSPTRISGPFEVLAETRDDRNESWGTLIAWHDHDGHRHEWAMPRDLLAGDGADVRRHLLDGGLELCTSPFGARKLIEYLITARTDRRARCVDTTGWHGTAYVTPGAVYGDTAGEQVILQHAAPMAEHDRIGTLEGWKTEVARYAVGNSRLALALSAAFVGPLLRLVGEESFGYHFAGGSSSGKTTALRAASSVFGLSINTWRTTDNSAEGLAAAANDGLLLLDELSQVDGRVAEAMAYMLGNGQGKGRMRKDGSNKPVAMWRLVFLSTGEIGLAEKIAEVGKKAKAGQSVRMIEIPADAGAGWKLFETLHGFGDGDALSRHLRTAAEQHRGHAGPAFLRAITADLPALVDSVTKARAEWLTRHLPPGADGQVSRVAARFALTAAAGELAGAIGILPWPDNEASNAAAICFRAWLKRRGGIGAAETEAGLEQVRAFIEAHGAARFEAIAGTAQDDDMPPLPVSRDGRTVNRAGFRRLDESGRWEYLVLPEAWSKEVCKGQDARTIARDLVARGLLVGDGSGKSSRAVNIPGHGKIRLYHLTAAVLDDGGAE